MHWLRTHPFALLFAAAGLCLLAIVIIIQGKRGTVATHGAIVTVSFGNTLQNPGPSSYGDAPIQNGVSGYNSETSSQSPAQAPTVSSPLSTTPSAQPSATQERGDSPAASQAPTVPIVRTDTLLDEVYALIPSNFFFVPPSAAPARTPLQQSLFEYGNRAGQAVIMFESSNTDMADVLKLWLEDRKNLEKRARADRVAHDMQSVGDTLLVFSGVPKEATGANENLAKAFQDAAQKLLKVMAAGESDDRLLEAMMTYNAAADSFAHSYVSLVDLFALYEVKFSTSDPGSAFSFTTSGL